MKEDSLKKRYFYKLLTNIISLPIALVTQAIIPRILGPMSYGSYSFLTGFFSSIIGFLDSGTSIGLYTKLSQRQSEEGLISFYWQFVLSIFAIIILLISSIFIIGIDDFVWPDLTVKYVYLGLVWAWMTWVFSIVQKILDAKGYTRKNEIIRSIQKLVSCVVLIFFYFIGSISLEHFFYFQYGSLFLYILLCSFYFKTLKIRLFPIIQVNYLVYIKEFYLYSGPLIIAAFVGLIVALLDRWFLQNFYGSLEQGYYGLAYQVGAVCFLFSGAMTPLFTREFAVAHANQNTHKKKQLFFKYVPLLYFIAAFLSLFITLHAETVMKLMGGDSYKEAVVVISIMAFYPIHQTYGQLCGSVFYSTDNTKLYRNIVIVTMLISLPISYFLIAPNKYYGLGFASEGLALKMVVSQLIAVNLLLYYVTRIIKINFYKFILHQIIVCIILFSLSYFSKWIFLGLDFHYFIKFMLSGLFYLISVLLLIVINPKILSLKRKDIYKFILNFKNKIV